MTGTEIDGRFREHYDSIKPTHTSDYNQPPISENPISIAQSFQISNDPVQRDNTTLRNKPQHVRFNVYDLRSSDNENGFINEEHSALPEVIMLSSDEEEPPKPKRARLLSFTDANTFPAIETSSAYSYTVAGGELDLVGVPPPSHHGHEAQNLNDSLEEFEMPPPLECPLGKVQSATSLDEGSVLPDQHQGAISEQSTSAFNQTLNQLQSTNNVIYGDFSITIGNQIPATVSTPSYMKQDSLIFNTKSSSNSAMGLLQSTYWDGKTPTQKQIRESVRNSLTDFHPKPGSYDPFPPLNNHVTNTARMAREYFSGAPPPGFLAGALVRKTPPSSSHATPSESIVPRTPVKSLSLGHEDGKMIRLQSDDRAMTVGPGFSANEPMANYPHASSTVLGGTGFHRWQRASDSEGILNYGEIEGNYPNINDSGINDHQHPPINRFADLKAFHQLQHQPSDYGTCASLPTNGNFNLTTGISNNSRQIESHVVDDPWIGRGVIGPPARAKV